MINILGLDVALDVTDSFGVGSFFWDLPNVLMCFLFLAFMHLKLRLPRIYTAILSVHMILPFFINGVIFEPTYMPDQYKYWHAVNHIRSGNFDNINIVGTVSYASYMLSVIPLPSVLTIKSLGFFNVFIYTGVFYWLYSRKLLTKESSFFYLLFPSFSLYSSLSLRDMLICGFMIISIMQTVRGKTFFGFLFSVPLFFIKFQNFFLVLLFNVVYIVVGIRKNGLTLKNFFKLIFLFLTILLSVYPFVIEKINFYRQAMYLEDGGEGQVSKISGMLDFISTGAESALYFIFKPFPWEISSFLQAIQAIENLIIFLIIAFWTITLLRKLSNRILVWIFFLFISMVIYGLVVFNFGTAVRYKFPFFVIYVIGIFYQKKEFLHENIICNNRSRFGRG